MGELSIPGLAAALRSAAVDFVHLVRGSKCTTLCRAISSPNQGTSVQPDPRLLNGRVQLTQEEKEGSSLEVFTVEIWGSIYVPGNTGQAAVRIYITDTTEGLQKAWPVHSRLAQWRTKESPVFGYTGELGKVTEGQMHLWDWIAVAKINVDWLIFVRQGTRKLRFSILILSCESGEEIACAECNFIYANRALGYMDFQENHQRAKTLGVALAFAVSASDSKMYDCEVELIKEWARSNIDSHRASDKAKRRLEKALNKTVSFFSDGNRLDSYKVCKEVVELAPLAERYDILELCLRVAQAKGTVTADELDFLKRLAGWLDVDTERFRAMMEKTLPCNIHEIKDVEVALGVTPNMSKEETRQHLNKEYRKWNARVTSSDPDVQSQADYMLKFIAEARDEYIV